MSVDRTSSLVFLNVPMIERYSNWGEMSYINSFDYVSVFKHGHRLVLCQRPFIMTNELSLAADHVPPKQDELVLRKSTFCFSLITMHITGC